MKVSELIEELSKFPQDLEVILSGDSEGNSYGVAYEAASSYYDPEDYELNPIHPDDIEEDEYEDLVVGVYLYP